MRAHRVDGRVSRGAMRATYQKAAHSTLVDSFAFVQRRRAGASQKRPAMAPTLSARPHRREAAILEWCCITLPLRTL